MKTTILTLALVFAFCTQFSFSNNLNIELAEENYIDDIPFNTEEIVSNIPDYSVNPLVLKLEEENYIDDIPFCTRKVYNSLMLNSSLNNLQLDDETYIDDIPFDTYLVSASSLDFYQIIFSDISNEMQSIFNDYYDEQIENLTRNLLEIILKKIENKSIEIINAGNYIVFP